MSVQYGGNNITFADGSTLGSGWTGFKNRIINGAMMIDQRNAGASVSVGGGAYTLDRWAYDPSATLSWFTFQQNGGSVTPPAGFSSYLGITSTGANSPTSGQFALLNQYIEGFNTADLAWGTANAATVTLSFWVRSSLTGTFGGALANSAFNRSYPFTYTITSANTWEQKSITITGDTSGTWVTNNGVGIRVIFGLGVGSSSLGTAGAWAGATYRSATGATNISATNGATFYITGVQLEKGSTATSFDYRPYGTELALCQRYFEKTFPVETAPANNVGAPCEVFFSSPQNGGGFGGNMYYYYTWKVTKRASPTVTAFNPRENVPNTWSTYDAGVRANTVPVLETINANALNGYIQRGTLAIASFTASAEL